MRQVWIALRLTLVEQAHNRFAMLLLAVYLPAWYGVIYGLTDNASIGFQLRAFHVFVATSKASVEAPAITLRPMPIARTKSPSPSSP